MTHRESQIVDGKADMLHCPIIPAFHHPGRRPYMAPGTRPEA